MGKTIFKIVEPGIQMVKGVNTCRYRGHFNYKNVTYSTKLTNSIIGAKRLLTKLKVSLNIK